MDVLEGILERIGEAEAVRDDHLLRAQAEDDKIVKLESLYSMLEDPATQEIMRDVVAGIAVNTTTEKPKVQEDRTYIGMHRVRELVKQIPSERPFGVTEIYMLTIQHRSHGDTKAVHPQVERQRKSSIGLALASMARGGDLRIVKAGRDRMSTTYDRSNAA